jgi:ribosomal protein S6--L-glutamate ligase
MRIAVIGACNNWYFTDLLRAASGRHEFTPVPYSAIGSHVAADQLQVHADSTALNEFDAALVRSMPPASLEQVVFRMDALAQLEQVGVPVVNRPKAIEAAVDKYLATARLQAAGLLVPPTIACQTTAGAISAFHALGGDVVVKPLFGGEGRGITRVSDAAVARRVFATLTQLGSVLYVQKFLPHDGVDWRLLVVGDHVLGMKRVNPDDWRTNISLGARPAPLEVTAQWAQVARRAAEAVGADVAGVDLLPARDGRVYAIEVNAVPGWRALAEVTGIDVSAMLLHFLEGLSR